MLMLLCTIAVGSIDLATMTLLSDIFTIISSNEEEKTFLFQLGFGFTLNILYLTIFALSIRFFITWYATLILNKLIFGVRTELSSELLARFLTKVDSRSGLSQTAMWKKLIYNESNQVVAFIKPILTIIFDVVLFCIILAGILRYASWSILSIVFVAIGIAFLITTVTLPQINRWGHERQKYDGKRLDAATKVIENHELVQSDRLSSYFSNKFKSVSSVCVKNLAQYTAAIESYPLLIEVIFMSLFILISSSGETNPTAFAPIAYGAIKALPILKRILTSMQRIKYGMVAVDLIKSEFNFFRGANFGAPESMLRKNEAGYLSPKFQIDFDNAISKNYIFDKLELPIKGLVCVTGDNGIGKSSWLRSVAGFCSIDKIDLEIDVDHQSQETLYIPQRSRIVAENFSAFLTATSVSEIDLHQLLLDLNIETSFEEKILTVPDLDAFAASEFSGGQQQRLNIGVKLQSSIDIFFFFFSTSEQDVSRSQVLINLLSQKSQTKLIICVTHDIKLLEVADFVFELTKNGDRLQFNPKNFEE